MSIWSITAPTASEPEHVRADRKSATPITAHAVEDAIRTPLGITAGYKKPSGSYSFVNPDLVARNRQRQAEEFRLYLEVDASFDQTFAEPISAPPPHSFVRTIKPNTTQKIGGTK
jgi:hypothetical protein